LEKLRETLKVKKERAILVKVNLRGRDRGDNLAELTALARSAGVIVVDRFQQKVRKITASTYIGKGKSLLLAQRVEQFDADVVIFDNDLSPAQIRELEKRIDTKVLDRSELILDIFATRARTKQAKLQVDLAQLEYTYPRLVRMWSHLDSVAGAVGGTAAGAVGGIGTRGTGEKQLEIDRRLVNKRITELKRELVDIDKRRIREIKARKGIFKICLVGYTNAGKSTVLNRLTDSDLYVEDRLFATLDTRTRKWKPNGGVEMLLSDTVGFIRNLPHQLIASFKATLEEAVHADLLLHIIDVSNDGALGQIESVNRVLNEIGCGENLMLKVFNKIDAIKDISQLEMLQTVYPDAVCISAKSSMGLDKLAETVIAINKGQEILLRVQCEQSDGKTQGFLRASADILDERYVEDKVIIDIRIGEKQFSQLKRLNPLKIENLSIHKA